MVAHHPHVPENYETFADGKAIFYSLGNFISAQSVGQNLIGGVLTFDLTVKLDDMTYEPSNIQLTPVITHYDGNYGNVRLYKLSEYTPEMAASNGVRNFSKFDYDYIFAVLEKNITAEYLNAERIDENGEIQGGQDQAAVS